MCICVGLPLSVFLSLYCRIVRLYMPHSNYLPVERPPTCVFLCVTVCLYPSASIRLSVCLCLTFVVICSIHLSRFCLFRHQCRLRLLSPFLSPSILSSYSIPFLPLLIPSSSSPAPPSHPLPPPTAPPSD